jgi:hypothetical protein
MNPVRIILDPDGLLEPGALEDGPEVAEATDWYDLRRAYEQRGRDRSSSAQPLIIIVRSQSFVRAHDLPFDIEQIATVVRLRIPAPAELRTLVEELPDELSDRAVQVLSREPQDVLDALLEQLWGVVFPDPYDEPLELRMVARLAADATLPPELWRLMRPRLRGQLALALAQTRPDAGPLQQAWRDWLDRGTESEWDPVLSTVGVDLLPLFNAGVLRPERRTATDLPTWTRLGGIESGPLERADELLAQHPSPWPPVDTVGWLAAAAWWGQLRAAMSEGGTELDEMRARGWVTWAELDASFGPWLRSNFGSLLTSTANPPLAVHQIPGFLARRIRAGHTAKVMLVVLDGMGFAQWSMLARSSELTVVEASGSFAMIPTLTPVSRQAIFAGRLPSAFAETLQQTDRDGKRWEIFWAAEGVDVTGVRYERVTGSSLADVPDLTSVTAMGVVVMAIDEMLHGSHLLGDAQVASAVRTWADRKFLEELVRRATEQRAEVWLTADHGNLEILPLGGVQEGLAVDTAGTRVRWYQDPSLRDGRRAEGIVWDPPGLPPGACYPLFAEGRGGYFSGGLRVTHGGISFDEVIVPLVQVTA